jgi:chromosome segregation ATPase
VEGDTTALSGYEVVRALQASAKDINTRETRIAELLQEQKEMQGTLQSKSQALSDAQFKLKTLSEERIAEAEQLRQAQESEKCAWAQVESLRRELDESRALTLVATQAQASEATVDTEGIAAEAFETGRAAGAAEMQQELNNVVSELSAKLDAAGSEKEGMATQSKEYIKRLKDQLREAQQATRRGKVDPDDVLRSLYIPLSPSHSST